MNPFWTLRDVFIDIANWLAGWITSAYMLGIPLLNPIIDAFVVILNFLARPADEGWSVIPTIQTIAEYIDWLYGQIPEALSWSSILGSIRSTFPLIDEVVAWWATWITQVNAVIDARWEEFKTWLGDQLDAAVQTLIDVIDDVGKALLALKGSWDDFAENTLPGLLTPQWITDFFGEGVGTIRDWWAAAMEDVHAYVDARLSGISDVVLRLQDLVDDPEEWLLEKIESMLERYWDDRFRL